MLPVNQAARFRRTSRKIMQGYSVRFETVRGGFWRCFKAIGECAGKPVAFMTLPEEQGARADAVMV
jgi:hypothetical protein